MTTPRVGGSFAPPLTDAKLTAYRAAAGAADPRVKDAVLALVDMAELFVQTPASDLPGMPHPSGRGVIVPLAEAEVKRIGDVVPWDYECDAYQKLFDGLPAGELRDAAFHLLWYAKELTAGREPITSDRLQP